MTAPAGIAAGGPSEPPAAPHSAPPAPRSPDAGNPSLLPIDAEFAGPSPAPPADAVAIEIPQPADPDVSPDVVLETYSLHPAAKRLWAWSQALLIALPLLPLSIVAGVWQGPWAVLAVMLLGLLAWRIASRHLGLAVARFRCERFARGLRYRHGVWWQSEVFIPTARIQHTEVNQGPLARRYGIGKLKVFTAAVQLGALEIDGLAHADAELLRDRLLGRARGVPDQPVTVVESVPDADRV